jgi:hypothetical protein
MGRGQSILGIQVADIAWSGFRPSDRQTIIEALGRADKVVADRASFWRPELMKGSPSTSEETLCELAILVLGIEWPREYYDGYPTACMFCGGDINGVRIVARGPVEWGNYLYAHDHCAPPQPLMPRPLSGEETIELLRREMARPSALPAFKATVQ